MEEGRERKNGRDGTGHRMGKGKEEGEGRGGEGYSPPNFNSWHSHCLCGVLDFNRSCDCCYYQLCVSLNTRYVITLHTVLCGAVYCNRFCLFVCGCVFVGLLP